MSKKREVVLAIALAMAMTMVFYSMNDSFYLDYRIAIMKYAQNAELMPGEDIPLDMYVSFIENKIIKIGYTDVNVKFIGEDLPGFENEIFIKAIPPQSPVYRLFRITPKTITYSYTFINRK